MRQARLDLFLYDVGDIHLEVRALAREAPCLGGLVRRTFLRERERIPRARPRRIQRNAPDDAVVGVVLVASERIERQQHIGPRGSYLSYEFAAQVEVVRELRVGMAQERDTLHAEHVRGRLLLLLSFSPELVTGQVRITRALVA